MPRLVPVKGRGSTNRARWVPDTCTVEHLSDGRAVRPDDLRCDLGPGPSRTPTVRPREDRPSLRQCAFDTWCRTAAGAGPGVGPGFACVDGTISAVTIFLAAATPCSQCAVCRRGRRRSATGPQKPACPRRRARPTVRGTRRVQIRFAASSSRWAARHPRCSTARRAYCSVFPSEMLLARADPCNCDLGACVLGCDSKRAGMWRTRRFWHESGCDRRAAAPGRLVLARRTRPSVGTGRNQHGPSPAAPSAPAPAGSPGTPAHRRRLPARADAECLTRGTCCPAANGETLGTLRDRSPVC
jgi:hypothetical protein